MLRLKSARNLSLIFKQYHARRQVKLFPLPQSCVCVQKVNFFTKSPYRKDAPLPNRAPDESDASIDLNKWKTVMRAIPAAPVTPVTTEEKIQVDEDEDAKDAEGDLTLEATRELVSMWRLAGKLVPQEISDEELQTLAQLTTKSSRKKYLKYLSIREGHKKSRKEKMQRKREQRAEVERDEGDDVKETELKSSLILQFWNRSLDKLLAWRSAQAMIFGQPLIFDLSYEGIMSKREVENTVSQLMEVEAWNRRASEPYHLHFCNLQPDSYYKQQLIKRYGEEAWNRLLITTTEKQHFEVFPREQLVYLTADSPNVLHTYDHSKVYIVGGLVDRSIQRGVSLAQAKRLKLATARLPLDEFLYWETGAKNLTLDQLIRILLTMKETGKWEKALQFVPTRKHDGFHSQQSKYVQNKNEKTFKSRNISVKPTFNRPKTESYNGKTKTSQQKLNRNWWAED